VVTSLVTNILTPIVAIPGTTDFSKLAIHISDSKIKYGTFLNSLISFMAIAAAVFFFVVKPVGKLMEMRKTEPDVGSPTKQCLECLSNIPAAARRCAFCSSQQPAP
jgi:large conductance mechanosensitive channel